MTWTRLTLDEIKRRKLQVTVSRVQPTLSQQTIAVLTARKPILEITDEEN